MRTLIVLTLALAAPLVFAAPSDPSKKQPELTKAQRDAVVAAYHALKAPEPENKKIDKRPEHEELARIDVSPRIRSASFGHRTWLLVPAHAKNFFVEYGRSTNTPAALFGPFEVKAATTAKPPAPITTPATTANDDSATGTPTTEPTRTQGPPAAKTSP